MGEAAVRGADGGVGAVARRAPVGVIRSVPQTRDLLRRGMEELLAVARARGVALADGLVDRTLAFVDTLPADGISSLHRDIAAGRPSELEPGAAPSHAWERPPAVATPVHTFIHGTLLPLELRARGELGFTD